MNPNLLAELTDLLGPRVSTQRHILEQHGRDESWHPAFAPDAVVFALSTEEVSAIVTLCARHEVPIIAFGAGTSFEGHVAALRGGICIDLSGMNEILSVNPQDLDCTVQAGVRREQLNQHLRDAGLFFPIDPGAGATIGGMVATRASGTNAVRYGTMRDVVLSLTVVLANGRVIRTARRARKSSAGYDLTRLFVGSEGTLGIVTEVTLKLSGNPEAVCAAVCCFPTIQQAVDAVIVTIQTGVPMARIEFLDSLAIAAVNRRAKQQYAEQPTLFMEFHGSAAAVAEQAATVQAIVTEHGAESFHRADSPEERTRLWKARSEAYWAIVNSRPGAKGWPTDVCVPLSKLAQCIVQTRLDLDTLPFPAGIVGHVGDGNFHCVLALDPTNPEEIRAAGDFNSRLIERALNADGTCTGEHGIGYGKLAYMEAEHGAALTVMRAIKKALDPDDLLNPGKVVAAASGEPSTTFTKEK